MKCQKGNWDYVLPIKSYVQNKWTLGSMANAFILAALIIKANHCMMDSAVSITIWTKNEWIRCSAVLIIQKKQIQSQRLKNKQQQKVAVIFLSDKNYTFKWSK